MDVRHTVWGLSASDMLELILAGTLFTSEPVAMCAIEPEGRRWQRRAPTGLTARCPNDVPDAEGLQEVADAALAAIDYENLELSIREVRYAVADQASFAYVDRRWQPELGQVMIERGYSVPVTDTVLARWMVCSASLSPDAAGVPEAPKAHCASDNPSPVFKTSMENRLLESLSNTRLLPAERRYCLDQRFVSEVSIHDHFTGNRWGGGGAMPDPQALPNMCEQ